MIDKNRWSEPDWEWLPVTEYDDNPLGSREIITGVLLSVGVIIAVILSLWNLFRG